jgi:polygalacturonase
VGDDAICMKSGKNEAGRKRGIPCENVIVSECIVYHGHGGFTIGSEMSGGIRNFDVSNCLFIGTDVGLRFKSTRGRGGVVENIYIRDINMFRIPNEAIFFDLYYGGKAPGESKGNEQSGERSSIPTVTEETPCFRNIYMKNVVCNGAGKAMYFNGLPEMPLSNISVENSVISATSGVEIRESEKVTLKNVIINSRNSPAVMLFNCKDLTMNGLMSSQGDAGILKIDGARSSAITIINSGFSREKIENSLCEGIVRIK